MPGDDKLLHLQGVYNTLYNATTRPDFRFVVSASEDTRDIIAAFDAFAAAAPRIDRAAMRQYATDHLDWRHKVSAFGVGA